MTIKELNEKHNWNIPETCPVCGTELIVEDSGNIICPNIHCSQKEVHKFVRYFSTLDIKGAGDVFVDKIVKKGYNIINYTKNCEKESEQFVADITECAGGKNGLKIIEATKKKIEPLTNSKLLALFDVEGFDVAKLKPLDSMTLENVLNLKYEDALQLEGFAEITSNNFINFISEYKNDILEMSKIFGEQVIEFSGEKFTFCFTGAGCLPRNELTKIAEDKGHKVTSSVSSKTNYLVTDDTESGSAKNKKAKELGISIIDSNEFLRMMEYEKNLQ